MHREYHPADMDHLRARAFGAGGPGHDHDPHHDHHHHDAGHEHDHDNRAALYVLTALMGLLIGGDVALRGAGLGVAGARPGESRWP